MSYAELHCISNFSFLRGASRPEELVQHAAKLSYTALAITDECSLAGVVKAHTEMHRQHRQGRMIKLIIGSEFLLGKQCKIVALAPSKAAYEDLSAFITLCRRRSEKGSYTVYEKDFNLHLQGCLLIVLPPTDSAIANKEEQPALFDTLRRHPQLWVGVERLQNGFDNTHYQHCYRLAATLDKPMVACGNVHMHCRQRKALQDTLTAIRMNTSVQQLGRTLQSNSERHLRPISRIRSLYPQAIIDATLDIARRCDFSLDELRYQYPAELVPPHLTPHGYLRQLVNHGLQQRWPEGAASKVRQQIDHEMTLIAELRYEYYFLTVHDLVSFARHRGILCQGRGSAANSAVCYCLFITEVDPARNNLLFERFISRERNEPPDIDVDFEHERREEVIQYLYKKYTRERAALTATVITYRTRSAIRDVGKALGFSADFTERLSKSLSWWDRKQELAARLREAGIGGNEKDSDENSPTNNEDSPRSTPMAELFMQLVNDILGFPRHLSQHVGGFLISAGPISRLVPVENASMPERTVIQWDKDDIEALGLLKVDVLALGMLSAICKAFDLVNAYADTPLGLADIREGDSATYDMLCAGDSIGVFQVESRAQISMLPRLRPRCFYDLVIQVAIVRPGPIQGDMVHPFLRRREGSEAVTYASDEIRQVLARTLGVPIFQEQVIKLAMVAAGFSGGEADQLRRAMASWGKNGNLLAFRDKLVNGMLERGYDAEFAERLFKQMKGFGAYGFPESHAASFALLVYSSAWLKCHHPAAFYAALLNSQPMGFYSPSQLVQDARRHGIEVRGVDIQHSHWDCSLEYAEPSKTTHSKKIEKSDIALRLGLRLVKGLDSDSAEKITLSRKQKKFRDLQDVINRAQLSQHTRTALIRANATHSVSGNRHQSHWQDLAVNWDKLDITDRADHSHPNTRKDLDDAICPPAPSEIQDIRADYSNTGLSLRRHPMQVLRHEQPFYQCKRSSDLLKLNHGRFVRVAGIVTGRQRPGTASGVIFLTLEDETGNINIVIWKDLQARYREALLKGKLLLIKGVMERKHSVIHVIAGQLLDYSERLEGFLLPSRDFH